MSEASVRVEPVRGMLQRIRFVTFPRELYADDSNFVPPIAAVVLKQIDERKNPFFDHAEQALFLARRDRRIVGRIAASIDRDYDAYHRVRAGMIGFFDFVDDPAVSQALMRRATTWLVERGAQTVLGPIQHSTNYEAGLLVDGFEARPCFLMTYNAPYYASHFERLGFEKAKDLLAWDVDDRTVQVERVKRLSERVLKRSGIEIRHIRPRHFAQEIAKLQTVYNRAWEANWGFVPLTDAEFRAQAHDMKRVLVPELCQIAERNGEPIAFCLALPDVNEAIHAIKGRLFPFGVLRLPFLMRKIDRIRVITLGVVPEARPSGLEAPLLVRIIEDGLAKGYRSAELSWVLEDNHAMNRGIEAIGGRPYKRYRIYEAAADRLRTEA